MFKPYYLLHICLLLLGLSGYAYSSNLNTTSTFQTIIPGNGNILYVNQNVTGGNGSGDSWENAIPELADALKWAKLNEAAFESNPLQIWIAEGTYYPRYRPDNLNSSDPASTNNSFLLVKNVSLYGGFWGTETTLEERQFYQPTILSGDFANNDWLETPIYYDDNAIRLLIGIGDLGNSRLDGLTITNSNRSLNSEITVEGQTIDYRSGLILINSNLDIQHCTFTKLNGTKASAIYAENTTLNINRSRFNENRGNTGTIHIYRSANPPKTSYFRISNSLIHNNEATQGSAFYFNGLSQSDSWNSVLLNCTIVDNSASYHYMIATEGTPVRIYNSILLVPTAYGTFLAPPNPELIDSQHCIIDSGQNLPSPNASNIPVARISSGIFSAVGSFDISPLGPAMEAGSNSLYTQHFEDVSNSADLEGGARLYNASVDIGASENRTVYQPPLSVTLALITDTGSSETDRITNVKNPVFGGTTAPLAGVALTTNGRQYHTIASETGEWNITVTQPLSDGTHQVEVQATKAGYRPGTYYTYVTIDTSAPIINGVAEGKRYEQSVTITFQEGVALLNGETYVSATPITQPGSYTITLSDIAGNTTTVSFKLLESLVILNPERILFVNKNVIGGDQTGESWQNAIPELADALAYAAANQSLWNGNNRLQIWVAEGNYKPLYREPILNLGDRGRTFKMVPYVDVYGGFSGQETLLDQRNWDRHKTVLDGDLLGNDTADFSSASWPTHSSRQDNAYQVVTFLDLGRIDGIARLDGVTIQNGNANDLYNYSQGGGILVQNSYAHLKNVVITRNSAYLGGGIALGDNSPMDVSQATVVNSLLINNAADSYGAAIYAYKAKLNLLNSAVLSHNANYNSVYTSTIYLAGLSPTNVNSIANSIVMNNRYSNLLDATDVRNSILPNYSDNGNIDAGTLDINEVLVDYQNGNFRPKENSVAINAGDDALYTGAGYNAHDRDLGKAARVQDGRIDIGPYESSEICTPLAAPTTAQNEKFYCGETAPSVWNFNVTPAEGATTIWYTSEAGGAPLDTDTFISTAGTYSVYAASSIGGCESDYRLPLSVTIEPRRAAPASQLIDIVLEKGEEPEPINNYIPQLEGHNFYWTNNEFPDYGLHIPPPTISTSHAGARTYAVSYLSETSRSGCTGSSTIVRISVVSSKITPNNQGIVYVNKNVAGGDRSGDSWENAVPELSDALEYIRLSEQSNSPVPGITVNEIWVAGGTYSPLYQGYGYYRDTEENNGFTIQNLKVYGGFNGTETTRNARNWHQHPTILNGNIGDPATSSDNVFSLVLSNDAQQETILDGFILEQTNGNWSPIALSNSNAQHIINHCIVKNHTNKTMAGGLSASSLSDLVISNSLFYNNTGSSTISINNNNTNARTQIINTVIADNEPGEGSGVYIASVSQLAIQNSIIWNNRRVGSATTEGADISYSYNYPRASLVVENSITQSYGGLGNGRVNNSLIGADPLFSNPASGDFSLQPGSPAINAGDNTFYDATLLGTRDLNGVDRMRNTTIDLGAFEVQDGDNPLPVTLINFTGQIAENQVNLTWNTTDEVNTSYFDIERSEDGRRFYSIGRVVAKETGSHTYRFNDLLQASQGVRYYRLRMVDLDGSHSYSQMIAVKNQPHQASLSVYPNPLQNSERITLEVPAPTLASLYGPTGQLVQQIKLIAGKNQISLPPIPAGLYLISDGQGNTVKIIVTQ